MKQKSAGIRLPAIKGKSHLTVLLYLLFIAFLIVVVIPLTAPLPPYSEANKDDLLKLPGKFETINNVETYVARMGPVRGPVVILIHGFGGSSYNWRKTMPALAEAGFNVYAIDLKGFGLSDKSADEDYSIPAQAEFLANFMEDAGIGKASLVGSSMGGNVVAHFALKYPDRVYKLVFMDAALVEDNNIFFGLISALSGLPGALRWQQFLFRYFITADLLKTIFRSSYFDPNKLEEKELINAVQQLKIPNWDLALIAFIRQASKNALPGSLEDLPAEKLIIWGRYDSWIPLEHGLYLNEHLQNSRLEIIDNAGHLPMLEQPELVNESLIRFLKNSI